MSGRASARTKRTEGREGGRVRSKSSEGTEKGRSEGGAEKKSRPRRRRKEFEREEKRTRECAAREQSTRDQVVGKATRKDGSRGNKRVRCAGVGEGWNTVGWEEGGGSPRKGEIKAHRA